MHRKYTPSTHTTQWQYTGNPKLPDAELPQRRGRLDTYVNSPTAMNDARRIPLFRVSFICVFSIATGGRKREVRLSQLDSSSFSPNGRFL